MSFVKRFKSGKGMTLIELLITLSIISTMSVVITTMFVNINNIQVKSTVSKEIQEELYILMEKVVQDIRNNSIDYRGYYVYNGPYSSLGESARYGGPLDSTSNKSYIGIPNPFPTGGDILQPAPNFFDNIDVDQPVKSEEILLLIDNTGKHRIKYRLHDPDGVGGAMPTMLMKSEQTYSNDILKECHAFPEFDSIAPYNQEFHGSHNWNPLFVNPDFCWTLDEDYLVTENAGYIPISSPNIELTNLNFLFHVHKSPYKIYEEDVVQRHPMVTLQMAGKYKEDVQMAGKAPELILQTTVSSRNYDEPEWSTL
jgi:prepilin-type N-terminal cleavage/methylation domain-containing protein